MKTWNRNGRAAKTMLALTLVTLGSCTVGPKYKTPATPAPSSYKEIKSAGSTQPNPAGYSDWWLVFQDDELSQLEAKADTANQDIKAAIASVEQAQAVIKTSRSYLFPSVSGSGSASRTREAQQRPNNGNTGGQAATYNDFQLSMVLGYEVDLWGKIRHSVQGSVDTAQSSEANLNFVRLVVETGVAMNYFGARELDAERDVLLATSKSLRDSLQLTLDRRKGGLATDFEVYQAKTLVDQTDAQTQHIDIQRAQFEHVIALLTGQPASTYSLPRSPLTGLAPAIPEGIPSELVEHRADVQSAERRVAAANEQIGVARALEFPQFTISAAAGFESVATNTLFQWQNGLASLGGGILAPVFTGGRLRAQVEQARAAYRQNVAQYEQSVLTAIQQVEDQLAAIRILSGEAASTAQAVEDAQRTRNIAIDQYKAGLVSYLNVTSAQTTLLYNQRTQVQIRGEQVASSVGLIKAIGGGWTGVPAPAAPHP